MSPVRTLTAGNRVIVEVELEIVEFIPGHQPHIVFQDIQWDKLAPQIEHKTALWVGGIVTSKPLGNSAMSRVCAQDLERCACSIEDPIGRLGADGDSVAHIKEVSFAAEAAIQGMEGQKKGARTSIGCVDNRQPEAGFGREVLLKNQRGTLQLRGIHRIEKNVRR